MLSAQRPLSLPAKIALTHLHIQPREGSLQLPAGLSAQTEGSLVLSDLPKPGYRKGSPLGHISTSSHHSKYCTCHTALTGVPSFSCIRPDNLGLSAKTAAREDFDLLASHMEAALKVDLAGLKQEVAGVALRVFSLEAENSSLHQSVSSLQVMQEEVSDQVVQVHLFLDDLENHNHRHDIRISGLPEDIWE